ncbi:MAG: hypothetical protein J6S75_06915, partial [Thermoguttaceae bacterium]|nr:hypothetical protein [Thermoguttaceae bacterium]
IRSFRLLRGDPVVKPVSKSEFRRIQRRLKSSEKAEPEDIVCEVLSLERDDPAIYRCGGEAKFEPLPGKHNFWVTDIDHRDPTAPQLTTVADAWDFCYQIFPRKRKDIFRLVRSNDKKMDRIAHRFHRQIKEKMSRLKNRPQEDQDDTPPREGGAPPEEKD